jgi:hypothetical protein
MTTTRMARRGARAASVLLAAMLVLGTIASGHADEAGKPGLTTTGGMREALTKLGEGRDIELVLANGKSYRGKLGSIGTETVILTQIAGKEFYDVLIALDEIAAVELRVRSN